MGGFEAITAEGESVDRVVFYPAPSAIVPGTPPTPIFTRLAVGTSALDPELVGEVLKVMRDLAEEGRTMVVVTHEMAFARDVSSEVMFLHQGKVEERGPPVEVFQNPKSERARQFLQMDG